MPHSSQQDSRSSAEISTEILLPLWMQSLSDMASTAPKACGNLQKWILSFFSSFFLLPLYWITKNSHLGLSSLPSRTHKIPDLGSAGSWGSQATSCERQSCLEALFLQYCETWRIKWARLIRDVCWLSPVCEHVRHSHTHVTAVFSAQCKNSFAWAKIPK